MRLAGSIMSVGKGFCQTEWGDPQCPNSSSGSQAFSAWSLIQGSDTRLPVHQLPPSLLEGPALNFEGPCGWPWDRQRFFSPLHSPGIWSWSVTVNTLHSHVIRLPRPAEGWCAICAIVYPPLSQLTHMTHSYIFYSIFYLVILLNT